MEYRKNLEENCVTETKEDNCVGDQYLIARCFNALLKGLSQNSAGPFGGAMKFSAQRMIHSHVKWLQKENINYNARTAKTKRLFRGFGLAIGGRLLCHQGLKIAADALERCRVQAQHLAHLGSNHIACSGSIS